MVDAYGNSLTGPIYQGEGQERVGPARGPLRVIQCG